MASKALHLDQAKHNAELAGDLIAQKPLKYTDWALIVAFYAALHYVEAFMAMQGIHSDDENRPHRFRGAWVSNNSHLSKEAKRAYKKLFSHSISMRYLTCHGSKGDWLSDVQAHNIVKNNFALLSSEIDALLAS